MKRRTIFTSKGEITLASNKHRIGLTVTRNSAHVASVAIGWSEKTEQLADEFVEHATEEQVRAELSRLQPFSEVVKRLDEALSNANTQTSIVAHCGAYGSATYGRHKV